MKSFWKEIKNEKRPVVIYGTGDAAEKLFNMLKKRHKDYGFLFFLHFP